MLKRILTPIKYQLNTQIQKNHPPPIAAAGILGPDLVYGIIVLIGTLVSIGWFITWTLAGRDLVNNFDI